MTDIRTADRAALTVMKAELDEKYLQCVEKGLKLDMSRGKPGADQLDISEAMLSAITKNDELFDGKVDTRNYGGLEGISSCRDLFAQLLGVPGECVLAGGNSSLTMMYDTLMRLHVFGAANVLKPWVRQDKIKWLCPVPGYDRHFAITEQLGYEMINIPMLSDGPDMDMVEKLVAGDESIKGIWCVPKYSNPEGKTYSDTVVRRLAKMKTAAQDFRIFWDNAYVVHSLDCKPDNLLEILGECKAAGNDDRAFVFASTSKISYPGAGVAAMAASTNNVAWVKKIMSVQAIGPDKINQLRHVRFFKNADGVLSHMEKHAAILAPKFRMVTDMLARNLAGTGAGEWYEPRGGYFISFNAMPGCAKRINELCAKAGVVMTGAGATYPYGKDPDDSNLRIAPSMPPVSELRDAMEVFCVCALLAAVEKRLAE